MTIQTWFSKEISKSRNKAKDLFMSCIICHSPYVYSTDIKCEDCMGKQLQFHQYLQSEFNTDDITKEDEKRFYERVFKK